MLLLWWEFRLYFRFPVRCSASHLLLRVFALSIFFLCYHSSLAGALTRFSRASIFVFWFPTIRESDGNVVRFVRWIIITWKWKTYTHIVYELRVLCNVHTLLHRKWWWWRWWWMNEWKQNRQTTKLQTQWEWESQCAFVWMNLLI